MRQDPDAVLDMRTCPECNVPRSVSMSRAAIESTGEIGAYAIICNHSWKLSEEEKRQVRERYNLMG